ncbi:hypothetical protein QR680_016028 [Steinernema hermaphroditum]|uniref:Sulfotransferase domain-containing protein n=1 Tax=Steinernema hermaphroditum TaxID=289476 RepID=A0AA39LLW7_9BILA|nr:hypothetical protein QR680_016028 [Steinernema hermaphroditum]
MKELRKYKLTTCVIPKNMSSIMAAIFCFLWNSKEFTAANKTIITEGAHGRFCESKNEYPSMEHLINATGTTLDDWTMLLVVRDPLDRFLSGFLDKCILNTVGQNIVDYCYGCGKDVACVLEKVYEHAWSYASAPAETRNNLVNLENYHLFPQNWHCSMELFYSRYTTLKYYSDSIRKNETMREIANVLKKANVPSSEIEYVLHNTNIYNDHSTIHSSDRLFYHDIITSSSKLLDLVHKIYYYDYEIFGYDFDYKDARSKYSRTLVSNE